MSEDDTPRRFRQPIFNVPGVVLSCCAVLLAIHAVRSLLPAATDAQVFDVLALLPIRFAVALGFEPEAFADAFRATAGGADWWTLLTAALLHASWTHVALNCLWLVAFGAAVARRLGPLRMLALLAVTALVGNLVYVVCNPTSFTFVIGASGGVSGMVGAVARFMLRPSNELVGEPDLAAFRRPALTLRQLFATRATLVFMAVFVVTNVVSGYFPGIFGPSDAPVAWQAHIGGFLAGLVLLPLFDHKPAGATPKST